MAVVGRAGHSPAVGTHIQAEGRIPAAGMAVGTAAGGNLEGEEHTAVEGEHTQAVGGRDLAGRGMGPGGTGILLVEAAVDIQLSYHQSRCPLGRGVPVSRQVVRHSQAGAVAGSLDTGRGSAGMSEAV